MPDETKQRRKGSWPLSQWFFLIALVLVAHLALIFVFGARKPIASRPVAHVTHLKLVAGSSEWLLLNNPTLFALPNSESFAWQAWLKPTRVGFRPLEWTEKPRFLPLPVDALGAVFNLFMETNRFAAFEFELRPAAQFAVPLVPQEPKFAEASTLRIEGGIARRPLLTPMKLPSWPDSDVIAPSTVQVLVNAAGDVVSAVLLSSSGNAPADPHAVTPDQRALALARTARFAPGPDLTLGELIFKWCTIPLPATNNPGAL
jgi:hypothetical protein